MDARTARRLLTRERQRLEAILDEAMNSRGGVSLVPLVAGEGADVVGRLVEREIAESVQGHAAWALREVDDALARLDQHRFGTCQACGEPIERERLRARPVARTCVAHARRAAARC